MTLGCWFLGLRIWTWPFRFQRFSESGHSLSPIRGSEPWTFLRDHESWHAGDANPEEPVDEEMPATTEAVKFLKLSWELGVFLGSGLWLRISAFGDGVRDYGVRGIEVGGFCWYTFRRGGWDCKLCNLQLFQC